MVENRTTTTTTQEEEKVGFGKALLNAVKALAQSDDQETDDSIDQEVILLDEISESSVKALVESLIRGDEPLKTIKVKQGRGEDTKPEKAVKKGKRTKETSKKDKDDDGIDR